MELSWSLKRAILSWGVSISTAATIATVASANETPGGNEAVSTISTPEMLSGTPEACSSFSETPAPQINAFAPETAPNHPSTRSLLPCTSAPPSSSGAALLTGVVPRDSNGLFPQNASRSGEKFFLQAQSPQIPPNAPPPPQVDSPDPNRQRFPQPAPNPEPPKPTEETPVLPPTPSGQQQTPEEDGSPKLLVEKIQVVGSTVLTEADIQQVVGPLEGKEVTLEELRSAADTITQIYLDRGYITSRALLADQEIKDGVVEIRVVEGILQEIQVEGNTRIKPFYIRNRIALGADSPLSTASLEDQLRLLRLDPLFNTIEASLRAGDEIGKSVLLVRVKEASPFFTNFSIDNFSPPSVGSERFGANVRMRNLTGIGDEVSVAYYFSNGDSKVYDFSYRVPVNAMNGTVQLRVAPNRNSIVQEPFDALNIRGESELYEVSFRQPLVRSPREELALSLGYTFQNGQTFTFQGPTPFGFGPDEDGVSRTSVIKFGQDYLRRDAQGAWSFRSQFSIGTGWFDATVNSNPVPDSRFVSWTGQVQRVQRLGSRQLLIIQSDLQLTPHSLLSSQQFVIGGGASLRGYRQNVRSGDNGFRFSAENRITVSKSSSGAPVFQVAPFIDMGAVWNHDDNPNPLPEETVLMGAGAGILWQLLPGFNIRLDYARPIIDTADKGTNAQDEGFYFSVNYGF
ncbi:ShlB/FhaC/HecB family hemolysin secretion/activation protein [[Phormidium] sp. ETS-05]|uniref:ShlB/FhaC/HecB family hemolysin secretion/activation protein n=1 Tax=[Phormidium] sp. ETS-05 TaxID=222819 RepID=UPI0018EF1EE3|nr:ShlB/FhaC/HecB family hemolysin secretion/activation protein [[Phormidium] sp. ETS-05]